MSSGLTDWQNIDALNMFVVTKATYQLENAIVDQTWATRFDSQLRKLEKKGLRLPKRTISSFFYMAKSNGGLGLTSLEDSLHTTRVSRVLSCLTSMDKRLSDIAWSQLTSVVRSRRRLDNVANHDRHNGFLQPSTPPPRKDVWGCAEPMEFSKEVTKAFILFCDVGWCRSLPGSRRHERQGSPEKANQEPFKGGTAATESS